MAATYISELVSEIGQRGYTKRVPRRTIVELMVHVTLNVGGLALFVVSDFWLLQMVALGCSTLGFLGVVTNTHTSAHGATSDHPWVNRALTYFGYPFMSMLSATYWRYKHNVVHHPLPNVVGADPDADLSPWFALTVDEYEAAGGWRKRWYDVQWLFFPLAIAANGFNVQFAGWRHLLSRLSRSETRRMTHWWDLAAMLMHLLVWLVLPSFFFEPLNVVSLYLLRVVLMGYAMFVAFAPAHFPASAQALALSERHKDKILIQTANTINFRTGLVGRFVCSGVDYQIEHHLFPNISHVHYPELSVLVKRYCKANGYPYRCFPWWKAIWQSLTIMKTRKRVVYNLRR